ncbi:hypothetical protein F5141DRAFT_1063110 [Pisolithus sp. B1]|nr:hypothetical protein F5141DRAFT_1063110 [Pisolithus sp. B1]
MHSVTGKLISHSHSGQNLHTIVLSSASELRTRRVRSLTLKTICGAGCPKLKPPEYLVLRVFTWWHDKNSTRLQAGQVVSTSSVSAMLMSLRLTSGALHKVLSVKAMDMEVKKSDDESSKDSISVLQIEVP